MKKFLCALMMAVLALGITACGGAAEQSAPAPAAKTQTAAPAADGSKKILVAYFSHTGNTEKVAQLIQSKTGADIFKIETATPYPSVYRETTELAKQEKADNSRPALKTKWKTWPSMMLFCRLPHLVVHRANGSSNLC